MTVNGVGPGTVRVDGFVCGTWKITRPRGTAALQRLESALRLCGAERAVDFGEGNGTAETGKAALSGDFLRRLEKTGPGRAR